MGELAQFQQALWVANVAVGVVLVALLIVRKNYRVYPAFFFYIFLNLAFGILVFVIYYRWGFSSTFAWAIAWTTLAIELCARALAVVEVCRHVLGRYAGIWALAWRLLLAAAALLLVIALLVAKHGWKFAFTTAQIGIELAIATAIIVLLVFAKSYDLAPEPPLRSLAIGFCLYSCFSVLNNTVLQRFLDQYAVLWNLLGMLAFLASLSLWTWTLRKPQSEAVFEEILLPADVYQSITPELNLRLRLLNEHLGRFWQAEARRS